LDSVHRDDLFGRLLAALLMPASGASEALLAGYQPPVALLELGGDSPPMVLLDVAGAPPEEVARRAERIVAAQGGRVLLVVAGGGDDYKVVLSSVGEKQQTVLLSTYHLDGGGKLARVAGPRVPALEKAAAAVLKHAPLAIADAAAELARSQKEREEAANFVAQLQGRRPWVTRVLVGACVLIHVLGIFWLGSPEWAETSREKLREGEIWRLLSAAFLHRGEIHLLMNMMGLWSFGGFLEPVLGWRRYLVLYGVSALVGSLASSFLSEAHSVGASGALWGLMLAGFALMRRGKSIFPARIASRLRQQMVGIVAVNVMISFLPKVDMFAHFGGGIAGGLLVLSGALVPRALGAVGDEPAWVRLLAPVTAVLLASSVVVALLAARPWVP
jgi:membrane associated rhomboid family serine protease